ncbi:hypothetical protein HGRIS_002565 [Hohenbuehelia grisea]|uniref:Uncharacterized protein n=1 Tax=Hohenbuehelia grisea TaxID=104357 RepID=A0ABR3JM36_9AGAR
MNFCLDWADDPAVRDGRVIDQQATPPSSPSSSQARQYSGSQDMARDEAASQRQIAAIQAALNQPEGSSQHEASQRRIATIQAALSQPEGSSRNEASQRQIAAIQAALDQPEGTLNYPATPSTPTRKAVSNTHGLPTPPQTRIAPTPAGKRKRDEESLRALSQTTPSKKTRGVTWAEDVMRGADSDDESHIGGTASTQRLTQPLFPPTPPSSAPEPSPGQSRTLGAAFNSVRTGKGKAREFKEELAEVELGATDEDNPFLDRGPATPPSSQSRVARGSQSHALTRESSSEDIKAVISQLADVPPHVEKIERQLVAARKSCEAKANRIGKLEAEVQRLADENKSLKSKVAALEGRRPS